jgi:hypothetical protein
VLFIASTAVDIASQILLVDVDSCPEFGRWLRLKRLGITVDFRRVERLYFDLRSLSDYIANLSGFEERSLIGGCDQIGNEIYDRLEDELSVVVKSIAHSECIEKSQIENELGKLIHLHHPSIAALIGFVLPIERGSQQEFKILRLYLEGCSLAEVVSANPVWWTSTVKAKVVAGIVVGLRFAHSLGLVHGHLTGNNILFDSNHNIQIVDFNPIVLEFGEMETEGEDEVETKSDAQTQLRGFSGEGWTLERDIQAFASILFELVLEHPPHAEAFIPTHIPDFVSMIIKAGLSARSRTRYSFNTILEMLKEHNFQIEDGVDSAEVSAFVKWVESSE